MTADYYDELLQLAARVTELAHVESELGGRKWKAAKQLHDQAEEEFKVKRKAFVNELLREGEDWSTKADDVAATLAEIAENADASWQDALAYTRDHLIPFVAKEARRSPAHRKLIKRAPYIIGTIVALIYFGVRLLSGTPVTAPVATKAGLQQRAAAFEKVLRYDDWASTKVRRGGWIKGILLWPIEATEKEVTGAAEFAGLALEGRALLIRSGAGCRELSSTGPDALSDEQIEFLSGVAERIQQEALIWADPPVATIIEIVKAPPLC